MSRKVQVNITMKAILRIDEGKSVEDVINELDYTLFPSESSNCSVEDTEILDYEVVDSK